MPEPQAAAEIKNGKLISPRVTDKLTSKIEKGQMTGVAGIVVHQTGGANAQSSLSSYEKGAAGAHFLIDTDGTIYQTARTNQKCWHVGNIRSRCYETKTCSAEELETIKGILFKKGEAYSIRIKKLNDHEARKAVPERYPSNSDSIGIELVAPFDDKKKTYAAVTEPQNQSLSWLVRTLQNALALPDGRVNIHPEVSYKQSSEASTAKWK
jgi:N-acetyl-anhydromuramyl-L-alanine amidase AmpD